LSTEGLSIVPKREAQSELSATHCSASVVELRKWAFEKAMTLKQDLDIVTDLIYKAAEIEAYIAEGKNPRGDFYSCVDTAMSEVDHASIPEVSEASKRKTMEVVRKWLKEYDALD
jgi:hypothetical protein